MLKYDPADFWTSRYEHFDITSSGHKDLPMKYNAWLYKMKIKKLHKVAVEQCRSFSKMEVLELGCGTGVYVKMWKNLGVQLLTGIDIAENAIQQLRKKYPEYFFNSEDLTDKTMASRYGQNRYDIVTVIGVLVHIIDEELFRSAVKNIGRLSKKDGLLLVSDYLVRGQSRQKNPHMKLRSLDYFKKSFNDAGFEYLKQVPLYFFMIEPFDMPSFWGRFFLPRIHSLVRKMSCRFPAFTGFVLYYLDSLITRVLRQGPSEKLLIFRKIREDSPEYSVDG